MPVTAPGMPLDAEGKPRYSYVVIEGPVGAGKSALAKVLAERWAMTPVFEHPEINPFLERFYRDPARHALAVQSQFLLQRSAHPSAGVPGSTNQSLIVSDFLPQKDVIYARLNLDPEEFALYQRMAQRLAMPLRTPDLVIYLQASPETLFARIQKRSGGIESQISDAYLRALCDAYNQFFYHYTDAPLMTVNAENLEPAENDADLGLLLDHIASMRGPRTFFVKGSL
jgi:deoxyadenosine/deoxycytidine kinase